MSDAPLPTRCFDVRDCQTGRVLASCRSGYWSGPKAYDLMHVPAVELSRTYSVIPRPGPDYIANGPGSPAHVRGQGVPAPSTSPPGTAPIDVVILAGLTCLRSYDSTPSGKRDGRARELRALLDWRPPEP
jgi:hypothetical protein